MHSTALSSVSARSLMVHTRSHIVGDEFMLLEGEYDADQLWFPFMRAAIFDPVYRKRTGAVPRHPPRANQHMWQVILNRKRRPLKPSKEEKKLYVHDETTKDQYLLPFVEGKRIFPAEYEQLKELDYPNWERTKSGGIFTTRLPKNYKYTEMAEWCLGFCKRRFHIYSTTMIVFECGADALLAKLRFS